MQQAGLHTLDLYENKGFQITYDAAGLVQSASNTGEVINIAQENRPKLNQDLNQAFNNNLLLKYQFEFLLFDFKPETEEILEKLLESIYGWIPVYTMLDLDKFLIREPFFGVPGDLESNVSHSCHVVMAPRLDINNINVKKFL